MTDPTLKLRSALGTDLDVLGELTENETTELLSLFQTAKRGQRESLDAALEQALAHLPWLVRGPARKILFG
jgi:hypothetical protein